jgi:hypothetical protein
MIQDISKNRNNYPLILVLLALISGFMISCEGSSKQITKRTLMLQSVDSLWNGLQQIRSTFTFQMDEFVERKSEMEQQLIKAQFLSEKVVTEEDRLNFDKYNGVYRIYKGMAIKYKQAVLNAEDDFYAIKGIEGEVKKGHYDNRVDDFKKEYEPLKKRLEEHRILAFEVTQKLRSVEPLYLRSAEYVDALLEKHVPEK